MRLLRERRFFILIAFVISTIGMSSWLVFIIQKSGLSTPEPHDINYDITSEDDTTLTGDLENTEIDTEELTAEQLAQQREQLRQDREKARNSLDRLCRRLTAMTPELDNLQSEEMALVEIWNVLGSANQEDVRFTQSMVEDYVTLRQQRESIQIDTASLSRRRAVLGAMLHQFDSEKVGTTFDELTLHIGELENSIEQTTRLYNEISQQAVRLKQRASNSGSHGQPLVDAVVAIQSATVASELVTLCSEREKKLGSDNEEYLNGLTEQTQKIADEKVRTQRVVSESKAETIRKDIAALLAAHEAEQKQFSDEIELKQAAIDFERDRAKIEYYLVLFIALKRTYTTPAVLDDEIKEFAWVDIPLELAASLTDIEKTGAFESVNAGSKVQRFGADLAGLKVQRSYP